VAPESSPPSAPRDARQARRIAAAAYVESGFNATQAARAVGVNPATFYRWLPGPILSRLKENDRGAVLFVDDQVYKQREVEEALLEAGFRIDVASSGREALEMIHERAYGCVITDQIMPGMDGIELCERILSVDPAMPIILLSAYTDFDLCRLAYDEKLVSYVARWEEFGRAPQAFADRLRRLAKPSHHVASA